MVTSWNLFEGFLAVRSRNAIKIHQVRRYLKSLISHIVAASDNLADSHQTYFRPLIDSCFNKDIDLFEA